MSEEFKFGTKVSKANSIRCNCHNKRFYSNESYEKHLDNIFLDSKKVKKLNKLGEVKND